MKIPPEIVAPYLAEFSAKTPSDIQKAEPVGSSAGVGSTPSFLAGEKRPLDRPPTYDLKSEKRARHDRKSGANHSGEERRKEDRRKSDRPVLLDTRSTRSRRASTVGKTINIKI